jgi:hypothetical protein
MISLRPFPILLILLIVFCVSASFVSAEAFQPSLDNLVELKAFNFQVTKFGSTDSEQISFQLVFSNYNSLPFMPSSKVIITNLASGRVFDSSFSAVFTQGINWVLVSGNSGEKSVNGFIVGDNSYSTNISFVDEDYISPTNYSVKVFYSETENVSTAPEKYYAQQIFFVEGKPIFDVPDSNILVAGIVLLFSIFIINKRNKN